MTDVTKASLSPARRRLVELMQKINYGRIEWLEVQDAEPVFDPRPKVVRQVVFGKNNRPNACRAHTSFALKKQVEELFEFFERAQWFVVQELVINDGLPVRMTVADARCGCRRNRRPAAHFPLFSFESGPTRHRSTPTRAPPRPRGGSMRRNKYDEGIDPYAVEIIRFKARQLVGQAGFTVADREDLEQELILDLLRRMPKYDSKRAKRNTFIARMVERAEKLDQEDCLLRTHVQPRAAEELRSLALDVAAIVETLPPELRAFCRRLGQETVSEISRDTGVPRGTLYKSIHRLWEIFEDAGLKDYL